MTPNVRLVSPIVPEKALKATKGRMSRGTLKSEPRALVLIKAHTVIVTVRMSSRSRVLMCFSWTATLAVTWCRNSVNAKTLIAIIAFSRFVFNFRCGLGSYLSKSSSILDSLSELLRSWLKVGVSISEVLSCSRLKSVSDILLFSVV